MDIDAIWRTHILADKHSAGQAGLCAIIQAIKFGVIEHGVTRCRIVRDPLRPCISGIHFIRRFNINV